MLEVKDSLPKEGSSSWDWLRSVQGDAVEAWVESLIVATGAPINQVKLTAVDGGWLLMLKARSASRGALVCFYGGESVGDCVDKLSYDVAHSPGITWKKDKYG